MKMFEAKVRFTWGEQIFSYRYFSEADAFMKNILLCEECLAASHVKVMPA